jgi:hypothetical protein
MSLHDEPSLDQLDDYDGKESPEKRRLIYLIIVGILIVGAIYSAFKYTYSEVDDYVGSPEKPGINTSKGY